MSEVNYIIHSSGPWKKHKYIKKEGNRYFYNYMNGTPYPGQKRAASPDSDSDPETNYTKRVNRALRTSFKFDKLKNVKDVFSDKKYQNAIGNGMEFVKTLIEDVNKRKKEKANRLGFDLILSPYESDRERYRLMGPKERSKLDYANEQYHKNGKNDDKYLMPSYSKYREYDEREYPKGMSYSNRAVNGSRKVITEPRKPSKGQLVQIQLN